MFGRDMIGDKKAAVLPKHVPSSWMAMADGHPNGCYLVSRGIAAAWKR